MRGVADGALSGVGGVMIWCILSGYFILAFDRIEYIASLLVVMIAIYGFYLRFISKKISLVSIQEGRGVREGCRKSLMIKNNTLRPFYVEEMYLIYDNKYALNIGCWNDEPFALEAQKAVRIKMKPYSYLCVGEQEILYGDMNPAFIHVLIKTIEGKIIHAHYMKAKKIRKCWIDKKAKVIPISIVREYYEERLIHLGCRYIVDYKLKGEPEKQLIIYSSGLMSEPIKDYDDATKTFSWRRSVPIEILDEPSDLASLLTKKLEPFDVEFLTMFEKHPDELEKFEMPQKHVGTTSYAELRSNVFVQASSGYRLEITS